MNVYYKLLGIYGKTHNEIDLDEFNSMVESFGFNPLPSEEDVISLLGNLKDGSKEYEDYLKYKSGEGNPIELLITRNSFIDNNGNYFKLDKEDIVKLVKLLQTNQELKNGNFNVKQFNKAAKNINGFRESKELLEYIFDIVDKLSTVESYISDSDEQSNYVNSSSFDTISRLNMKQRQLQNLSRKYNKLKRETIDTKLIKEKVLSELKHVKIGKPIKLKDTKDSKEKTSLVVGLSDIHVGLRTKDFNLDILRNRLNEYIYEIKKYTESNNVDSIYIVNIGDSIENIYMHLNQMSSVELNLAEQVAMAVTIITEFVQNVRNLGYKTYYCGIMGNHDRLNPNLKQNIIGDSVSLIINTFIKANQSNLDIEFIPLNEHIRGVLNIKGINICVTHGDYDKLNKPDVISKLSTYFDTKIDIVLGGHYHNLLIKTLGKNQYVIQSGAMFTGNPYSDSLGVTSNACQVMLGVTDSKDKAKVSIIPVILD